MDLKLTRQPLFIHETLLDTTVEQPIECDALLPDYCPDIARILKCTVDPAVTSRKATAGRLEIEGMAVITVLYVTGGNDIARGEYKVPFSKMLECRNEVDSGGIMVNARTDYVNCRAVNQRRLDIRGAIVISVKATVAKEEQVIAAGTGGGIQLKKESCRGTRALGQCVRESHMTETLELAYGKPPIQSIIRAGTSPRLVECKVVGGKAVLKGEIAIHVLYHSTLDTYECMEFTVPTSVVAELDGMDDTTMCDVAHEMLSLSLEPATDGAGEYRNINMDAVVQANLWGYKPYEGQVCSDCYSTQFPCSFRSRTVNVTRVTGLVRENFSHKENLSMPENVESVMDLWCDVTPQNVRSEPGGVLVEARLSVTMLAKMTSGEVYCFDKVLETQYKANMEEGVTMTPRLMVTGCAFTFTGGDSMEVRCDLLLEGTLHTGGRMALIDEVAVDDKNPKTDLVSPGLYIYMADPGETMWDIAKRYNTNIDKIMEENPSEPENNARQILLIPV